MKRRKPFAPLRVVMASKLPPLARVIWWVHYGLDNGRRGAYAGAVDVARYAGCSRRMVEYWRPHLVRLGLLVKVGQRGTAVAWHTALPPACAPRTPSLTDDRLDALAEALNDRLDRLGLPVFHPQPTRPHNSTATPGRLDEPEESDDDATTDRRRVPPTARVGLVRVAVSNRNDVALAQARNGATRQKMRKIQTEAETKTGSPGSDDLQRRDETPTAPADASRALDFRLEEPAP